MVRNTLPIWVCLLACLVIGYMKTSVHAERYCGDELSKALDRVCSGHYNTKIPPFEGPVNNEPMNAEMTNGFGLGSLGRSSALGLVRFRGKRGVVDRCCKIGCSEDYLKEYCL